MSAEHWAMQAVNAIPEDWDSLVYVQKDGDGQLLINNPSGLMPNAAVGVLAFALKLVCRHYKLNVDQSILQIRNAIAGSMKRVPIALLHGGPLDGEAVELLEVRQEILVWRSTTICPKGVNPAEIKAAWVQEPYHLPEPIETLTPAPITTSYDYQHGRYDRGGDQETEKGGGAL